MNLNGTGTLELNNPTLQVSVGAGYDPAESAVHTIVTGCAGLSGTFAGLPDGARFVAGPCEFAVHYHSGAGTITLQARPGASGLLIIVR